MPLTPGERLGAYEIVALIGAGGMGEVYRARDPRLGRDVAIKVLPPAFSSDPDRLRRFEQEARAAAALNHPNILAVHDIGTHSSTGSGPAAPYVVSELLEGDSLDQRLQSAALPMRKTLEYALQLARGLAAAHDRGVVHRDLKPANVFITLDGRVKILDFGLAKLTEREPSAASGTMMPTAPPETTPGLVLGTIGYMSPEQVRGLPADHRSDIFAFGAILYEMLSGRRAFAGATTADTMTAILKEDPPDLPAAERHIPPALARIVDRCLEKHPASRFQSAGDLGFAIEALSSHSGTTEAMPAAAPVERQASTRIAWTLAAVLGVAVTAALGLAAQLYFGRAPIRPETIRFTIPAPDGWTLTTGNLRLAISPDGRRVAFVARSAEGKSLLWVRLLDTLSAQAINGTDGAANPFWSADSRFVAFFAGGKLKKIDVNGGPPFTLCDSPSNQGGTWSRDGVIVFGGGGTLLRVPASGGIATAASVLGKDESAHSGPWFLPDGRHFIYSASGSSTGGSAWTNYVGSLDSTERVRVANAAWPKALYAQGHILFPRDATLMAQPFDVRRFATTGEAFPVAEQTQTLTGFGVGLFSVSETGALVYQTGGDLGSAQLVWMDRSGKTLDRLGERAAYGDLQLSNDARRATVSIVDAAQRTRDIWVFDVQRGLRTRFTFDGSDELSSAWSPDGGRIAFNSRRKGRLDLYVKSSSGAGDEELLFADALDKYPASWSPDGRYILYLAVGGAGPADLWVLPLSGDRKPIPFAQTRFAETPGAFSPDGKWIAYTSDESGRNEVYVAPFPRPGGKWQISTNGGGFPRWRADGKELFYVGADNRVMAAAVSAQGAAFDVGAVKALFPVLSGGPRFFFAAAPDGQRFLVNAAALAASAPPITVVLNWLEGIKK